MHGAGRLWLEERSDGGSKNRDRSRRAERPGYDAGGLPQLDRIRVAPVSMGRFVLAEVTAPGEVEVNPNRVSHVLMPVTGRIREVLVHLGDTVTEGQPVVGHREPGRGRRSGRAHAGAGPDPASQVGPAQVRTGSGARSRAE